MRLDAAFVVLVVAVFTSSFAFGQGSNGAISGTVTDQTRAVLPGVLGDAGEHSNRRRFNHHH